MATPRISGISIYLLTAVWGFTVISGLAWLAAYQQQAANVDHLELEWPSDSSLVRAKDRPTLLMFLHPRCPCSRASLEQLARIVPIYGARCSIQVVLVVPPGLDRSWTESNVARATADIPEVTRVLDLGAVEADRFGAAASGQAFLFGRDGRLHFSGGITGARGHVGGNPFDDALRRSLDGALQTRSTVRWEATPVFGCPLRSQELAGQHEVAP